MNKILNYKLLLTGGFLKVLIAILQFLTSIIFLRYLGAAEYGKIIAVVAVSELALMFTVPGIQKAVLKLLAVGRFPLSLYVIKIFLSSIAFIFLCFQFEGGFYISIAFLMCIESVLSLNRSSIHAKQALNTFVFLDAVRPIVSIILLLSAIYFQFGPVKEIYVMILFISIVLEFAICTPYVIDSYRNSISTKQKVKNLVGNAVLASGFSYGSTILRKLPIVVAGSLAAELSALVSIFLQFYVLVNYLISTVMLQVSIKLLNRELQFSNVLSFLNRTLIVKIVCAIIVYFIIIFVLDYTKFDWLPLVFSYKVNIAIPLYTFSLLPFLSLLSQVQFYNLYAKSCRVSNYFILGNIIIHLSIGVMYFYCSNVGLFSYEAGVLLFHSVVLVLLILSEFVFGKVSLRYTHMANKNEV